MEQTTDKNPLGYEAIGRLIRKFSIPCVISLLVNSLYNIVDQIFIGQGVGYLGNAATNIVFPLTVIALAFAVLVGDGAASYLSINLGKNDKKEASKGVNNAIILIIIIGIIFLLAGIMLKPMLLQLFGVTDEIYHFSETYMSYIVLGLPFMMFTTCMNSMIRADGSPKYAMSSMLIGAIINVILDPIMIFTFGMGVEGAAIATIIGQIASFLVSLIYIKKFKSVEVSRETLKPDFKTMLKTCELGVSSFITQISITVVMVVMNHALGYYGANSVYGKEIPISALGIVMKVNQILISIIVGISIGAQPIIGFNYGAKQYDRVKKAYFTAIKIALTVSFIGFILFQFFPEIIINLFGQEEPLYNQFAKMCFRIYLACCILNGVQIVSSIFFQSIGKPLKSAILSLSRQFIILIPAILILPIFWGIEGIVYAGPTADMIAFVITLIFIVVEMKHIRQLQKEKQSIEEIE